MEPQKDNQINLQKDNQKGQSQVEEVVFNSAPEELYIYRKIEKIGGAIHLLTTYFDSKEPLRMSLRNKSLEALSISIRMIKKSELAETLNSLSLGLIEIKSLLHTSYLSGLISEMNFHILRNELELLVNSIEGKKQVFIRLPISYLHVQEFKPVAPPPQESYKGQPKGQEIVQTPAIINKINMPAFASPGSSNASERTGKILSLLKNGRALTIKDFSEVIKGCSEKTLQRELLKLVSEGKIVKRGERRWSRYSLV
jgi:hypothetical protein